MELKDIFTNLKDSGTVLVLGALFGVILGYILYNLPLEYKAHGSFYISRDIQASDDGSFSYEGYYSQQVAISFTNSAIALIESPDIGSKTLGKLKIPVTETTLRKYNKKIKATKTGPQVFTLTTKDKTPKGAMELWSAVASSLEESIDSGFLKVNRVSESPVVVEPFKNPLFFSGTGGLLGFSSMVLLLSLISYFRGSSHA